MQQVVLWCFLRKMPSCSFISSYRRKISRSILLLLLKTCSEPSSRWSAPMPNWRRIPRPSKQRNWTCSTATRARAWRFFINFPRTVDQTLLLLALSPEGVALNGQSCQVLAVLITPLKESGSHFQLLARLTGLLRNPLVRRELLAKETPTAVWRAIRREEESGHENYWVLSREEIFEELTTGLQGLSPEEARRRLEEIGPNRIVRGRRRPCCCASGPIWSISSPCCSGPRPASPTWPACRSWPPPSPW